MLLKQNYTHAIAVDGVLSDGVAGGVAGAMPCYSLAHLTQCLTTAVELAHEGSTVDLHCCPQGDFHTRPRTADTPSCGAPLYAVETSLGAG